MLLICGRINLKIQIQSIIINSLWAEEVPEMKDIFPISSKENKIFWIDFSEEKIEKVLFLDIDGVIQPFTDYRFKYVENKNVMEKLYLELESKFNFDYRQLHKYDVAAVYYDWDRDAVHEIKRILDTTGAKIVISSDWRSEEVHLPYFLRIHDLEQYLYGFTPLFNGNAPRDKYKGLSHYRSIEILEYLRTHPHIKKWVAVDDKNLPLDFPQNAVVTHKKISADDADKCIEILNV